MARAARGRVDRLADVTDDLQIRPIDLLDPAQQEAAIQWMGVHSATQRRLFGDRGHSWTLPEVQAFHRKTDKKRIDRAAWRDGRIVGAVEVLLPLHDNPRLALLWLSVDPDHRRLGIGSALLGEAERLAADAGRTLVFAETEWAAQRRDESETFAKRHGYAIGQTILRSEQALPADRAALAAVLTRGGAQDYDIESAVDELPEEWLADRAHLARRMSTDAPTGEIDLDEEEWDAERVRRQWGSGGATRGIEAVARHRPTGRLVGYTDLTVRPATPHLAYQQDTLVLTEHRGHNLGLRLKAATALRLMDVLPEVTAVRTWNAASNDHMLAVNRELGYVVDGYTREWQKVVKPGR
jgi:GNAT superfamily N-acetyltransferase